MSDNIRVTRTQTRTQRVIEQQACPPCNCAKCRGVSPPPRPEGDGWGQTEKVGAATLVGLAMGGPLGALVGLAVGLFASEE